MKNLWGAFIPIYYIVGLVPLEEGPLETTFDAIYSKFSPTCAFIPVQVTSFTAKHNFSIRLLKHNSEDDNSLRMSASSNEEIKESAEIKIEDLGK